MKLLNFSLILGIALALISTSRAEVSCIDLFAKAGPPLQVGREMPVSPRLDLRGGHGTWLKGHDRILTFVGAIRTPGTQSLLFVFTDSYLDTYYFNPQQVLIDQKINGEDMSISPEATLPMMVTQSEGSCNLCAHLMAANQRFFRLGLPELALTGTEAEANLAINRFSAYENVRQYLYDFYAQMWPEGYVENQTPRISWNQMLISTLHYRQRLHEMQTRALLNAPDTPNPAAIRFLHEVAPPVRTTRKAEEFLQHLRAGGTAVVAGRTRLDMEREATTPQNGPHVPVSASNLTPYRNQLAHFARGLRRIVASAPRLRHIFSQMRQGYFPDNAMIEEFLSITSYGSSHAIAAVGIIAEGPLRDHVIMMNSWGIVEIYPATSIQDGMWFTLLPPDRQLDLVPFDS